jgi:hypothetical protein
MPNPAKPIEQKRLLGNPGKRTLPKAAETVSIPGGWVEPLRELQVAGQQLWDSVFQYGELWVSSRTDIHLLQMTCEQLDRRDMLAQLLPMDPTDKNVLMRLAELEKLITSNLGLLGFTPSDRSRLGLAEIKAKSRLQELMDRNG